MDEIEKFINELQLPATQSEMPSVYAFSLHKAGSTLLFNMLMELAPHVGLSYFSIQDQMFINGIAPNANILETAKLFKPTGYLYGGFRFYPTAYKLASLGQYQKILLVRNPMDTLVSMYFSRQKSHVLPDKGSLREIWLKRRKNAVEQDIEEFVRDKYQSHMQRIKSYVEILSQENCILYRYEDVIYDKLGFLKNICNHYEWNVEESVLQEIVSRYDIFPETENQENHIRQVHPGNYKKQLSVETQQFLEEEFRDILEAFGYSVSSRSAYNRLVEPS